MSYSATNYFSNFQYKLVDDVLITQLLNRAILKNTDVLVKSKIYYPYTVLDGEKPENVAEKYYQSTEYFWLVLLANNIKNIYEEWPKSLDVFHKFIIEKYSSLKLSQSTVDHYEDDEGYTISKSDWNGDLTKAISQYDCEYKLNEEKRHISLIRIEYRDQIVREFNLMFK